MRIELEPSYILHTRPYRETSLLVYALTEHHGLMHMVCRGARKKSAQLQPFMKMYMTWSGRGELVSLNKFELDKSTYTRDFRAHVQCFYLHELILALIPKMSPEPELFNLYEETLKLITEFPCREEILRKFELQILSISGHPLQLKFDHNNDLEIEDHKHYRYEPDLGPTHCVTTLTGWDVVSGKVLRCLDEYDFHAEILPQAKIFLRGLIKYHLQGKPIMARQLLRVS
ncbi:MAG: DNA repair protein RecO [Pseudomonadota bacterium]